MSDTYVSVQFSVSQREEREVDALVPAGELESAIEQCLGEDAEAWDDLDEGDRLIVLTHWAWESGFLDSSDVDEGRLRSVSGHEVYVVSVEGERV